MSGIIRWVNDELMSVLGYNDAAMSHFMIAMAKKSTDADDFIERIRKAGYDDVSGSLTHFAIDLLDRVPHASKAAPQVRGMTETEKKHKAFKKLNASMKPLSDDDDVEEASSKSQKKNSYRQKARAIRKRKQSNSSSSGEEEKVTTIKPG